MKKFLWYWMPIIIYCIVIFVLSSLPITAEQLPGPDFKFKDLLLHSVEFFILSFLFLRAFVKEKWQMPFYFAILFTILYGCLDEIHQLFVSGRILSFLDVVFNMIGALLILFFKILKKSR